MTDIDPPALMTPAPPLPEPVPAVPAPAPPPGMFFQKNSH